MTISYENFFLNCFFSHCSRCPDRFSLTLDVPGKYLLVDHGLARAIDRGAVGEIVVEGEDRPELFKKVE